MSTANRFKGSALNTGSVESGKILSRYVKKNALLAMLFAVLALWGLQVVFSYLSELEDLSDTYTYVDALKYIMYRSPYFLEQFIPTGALLGAVVGLGLLANNSELIVMRAAGVSIYRIVAWVLQPAFIFVLLALAINQYVLPHTNLMANKTHESDTKLLASVEGYWTLQKDTSKTNQTENESEANQLLDVSLSADLGAKSSDDKATGSTVVFIDYADANGNIGEVKRWHLDANNNLTYVSKANGGTYLPDGANETKKNNTETTDNQLTQYQWRLNELSTLKLADRAAIKTPEKINKGDSVDQTGNPNTNTQSAVSDTNAKQSADIVQNQEPLVTQEAESSDIISLPISPSSVFLLTRSATNLSLTQLYEHKRFNASQGTRSLEHELAFWQKILSPLAILSLVIVACSFVFGSLRTHSLGLRIVVALLFGLLFSYIQDLTGFISLATGVSPLLMVLLPIVGSTILGLYLIKRQQ